MSRGFPMAEGHKPTPAQRRGALVSAVVLAAAVVAVYFTYLIKVYR